MDIDSSLFSRVTLDAGRFGAGGKATLILDGVTITLPVSCVQYDVTMRGSITIGFAITGTIETEHIDAVDELIDGIAGAFGVKTKHIPAHDVPKPGALPQIEATFWVSSSVRIDNQSLCARLVASLAPGDAVAAPGTLAGGAAQTYRVELGRIIDIIKSQFPLDDFPLYSLLNDDLRAGIRSDVSARIDGWRDTILNDTGGAVSAAFDGLYAAVIDYCTHSIAELRRDAELCIDVLIASGRLWSDVFDRFVDAIVAAVEAGRSAISEGAWLIDALISHSENAAAVALVRLLAAMRHDWDLRRGEANALLAQAAASLGNDKARVAAFLAGVVRDLVFADGMRGHLDEFAHIIGDAVWLAWIQVDRDWKLAGQILGEAIATLVRAGASLDAFAAAFYTRAHMAKADVFDLMRGLGDDDRILRLCEWMSANWIQVQAAIFEAEEEIRRVVDAIARLVHDAPRRVPSPLPRLVSLFRWMQGVPAATVQSEALRDGQRFASQLQKVLRTGLWKTLDQQAQRDGTSMVAVARSAFASNALSRSVDSAGEAVRALFNRLGATGDTLVDQAIDAEDRVAELISEIDAALFAGGAGESPLRLDVRFEPGASRTPAEIIADVRQFSPALADQMVAVFGKLIVQGSKSRAALGDASTDGLTPSGPTHQVTLLTGLPNDGVRRVLIAHLPRLDVLDMRYRMPYGARYQYGVSDLDGDGRVGPSELDAIRRAIGSGAYQAGLDADRDQLLTTRDLQLAIDQSAYYVNGLMYRPTVAPLAFQIDLDGDSWLFGAFASLDDESMPGRVTRRGIVFVMEAQINGIEPAFFPLRVRTEERWCLDVLSLDVPKLGPVPLVPSPWMQRDLVLRGGPGGGNFQLHLHQPMPNPLARTFTMRLNLQLQAGMSGAIIGPIVENVLGVHGRGGGYVQVVYESDRPVGDMLGSFSQAASNPIAAAEAVVGLVEQNLELLVHLVQAVSRICGPWMPVAFGWTDPRGDISAVVAYLEQHVLLGFTAAPTWSDVSDEADGWLDGVQDPSARDAVTGAIADVRLSFSMVGAQPAVAPGLILDAIVTRLAASSVSTGDAQTITLRAREALEHHRARFAVAYDQVVGEFSNPATLPPTAPLMPALTIFAGHPITALGTVVRAEDGKELKLPYRSVIRFGTGVSLSLAPIEGPAHASNAVAPRSLGTVEGSRILLDQKTDGHWLFVRTDAGDFGWVRLGPELADKAQTGIIAAVASGTGAIIEFYASPPNTLDNGPDLARARRMLLGPRTQARKQLTQLYDGCVTWLKLVTFRLNPEQFDESHLRLVIDSLTAPRKSSFWTLFSSDLRCIAYLTTAGRVLLTTVLLPALAEDFELASAGLADFMASVMATSSSQLEVRAASDASVAGLFAAVVPFIKFAWDAKSRLTKLMGEDPESIQTLKNSDSTRVAKQGDLLRHGSAGERFKAAKYFAGRLGDVYSDENVSTFAAPPSAASSTDVVDKLPGYWQRGQPDAYDDKLKPPMSGTLTQQAAGGSADVHTVELKFGSDRLSFSWAAEAAGGAGAGQTIGGSATANLTGGMKVHAPVPTFPVEALLSPYSLGVFLRFGLRMLHHFIQLGEFGWSRLTMPGAGSASTLISTAWQTSALSVAAIYQAFRDIAVDHPAWVAQMLDGIGLKFEAEVNATLLGALGGGGDASDTVRAIIYVPISGVMWPLARMMEARTAHVDGAALLSERIVPRVRVTVEDRLRARAIFATGSLEIESAGVDFFGQLSIPQDSAWRGEAGRWLDAVGGFLHDYEMRETGHATPAGSGADAALNWMDAKIRSVLMDEAPDQSGLGWLSPDPLATLVLGHLMGWQTSSEPARGDKIDDTVNAITTAPRLSFIPFGPGKPLDVTSNLVGFRVSILLNDADTRLLAERGFDPPSAPTDELENISYEVTLPAAPVAVRWHVSPEQSRRAEGIIAGFESLSDARAFASARDTAWLGTAADRAGDVWAGYGQFWTWIEAGLVERLIAGRAAMPELTLAADQLTIAFVAVPRGIVAASGAPILNGIAPSDRTSLWRVVLADQASREDYVRLLRAVVV